MNTKSITVEGMTIEVGPVTLGQVIALSKINEAIRPLLEAQSGLSVGALLSNTSEHPMQVAAEAVALFSGFKLDVVLAWPLAKTIRVATAIGQAFVEVNAGYLSEVSTALEDLTRFGASLTAALQQQAQKG